MPGISSQDKLSMVVCPGGEKVSMSDGAVRHPMQGKKLRPY